MEIRPIRTEADYSASLEDIERYFDNEPEPGTPEADRFDVLATLIGAYERGHWSVDAPDAVSAIAEVMAMRGYARADLVKLLGSASRASEIMNRKRRLTLEQARKLHDEWHVPAASLLADGQEPTPARRKRTAGAVMAAYEVVGKVSASAISSSRRTAKKSSAKKSSSTSASTRRRMVLDAVQALGGSPSIGEIRSYLARERGVNVTPAQVTVALRSSARRISMRRVLRSYLRPMSIGRRRRSAG